MYVQSYYSTVLFSLGLICFSTTTSSIEGTLSNVVTGEPIVFATIVLYKNDRAVTAVATDLDGNYLFKELASGVYELKVVQKGYEPLTRKNVYISDGESKKVYLQLASVDSIPKKTPPPQVKEKGRLFKKLGVLLDKLVDRKLDQL